MTCACSTTPHPPSTFRWLHPPVRTQQHSHPQHPSWTLLPATHHRLSMSQGIATASLPYQAKGRIPRFHARGAAWPLPVPGVLSPGGLPQNGQPRRLRQSLSHGVSIESMVSFQKKLSVCTACASDIRRGTKCLGVTERKRPGSDTSGKYFRRQLVDSISIFLDVSRSLLVCFRQYVRLFSPLIAGARTFFFAGGMSLHGFVLFLLFDFLVFE